MMLNADCTLDAVWRRATQLCSKDLQYTGRRRKTIDPCKASLLIIQPKRLSCTYRFAGKELLVHVIKKDKFSCLPLTHLLVVGAVTLPVLTAVFLLSGCLLVMPPFDSPSSGGER